MPSKYFFIMRVRTGLLQLVAVYWSVATRKGRWVRMRR